MSNLVREKLEDYFASVNPTSSRMMADIMSSKQEHSKEWESLPQEAVDGKMLGLKFINNFIIVLQYEYYVISLNIILNEDLHVN